MRASFVHIILTTQSLLTLGLPVVAFTAQPPSSTDNNIMPSAYIDKLALVLVQGRRHLVARSRGKNVFFTPGGKRDPGEDDHTALCRECREELTVDLNRDSIKPYGVFEAEAFGKPAGTVVRMTCYTADYTGTLAPDEEIEELAWIQSDFPGERLSEAGRMILADLKAKNLID